MVEAWSVDYLPLNSPLWGICLRSMMEALICGYYHRLNSLSLWGHALNSMVAFFLWVFFSLKLFQPRNFQINYKHFKEINDTHNKNQIPGLVEGSIYKENSLFLFVDWCQAETKFCCRSWSGCCPIALFSLQTHWHPHWHLQIQSGCFSVSPAPSSPLPVAGVYCRCR